MGEVRALDTIRFSVSSHRGCYGECNFCAIAVHEGRTVRWRSQESIADEVQQLTRHPDFKGYIQDVGGPTANMYGFECAKKLKSGACPAKRCLYPAVCAQLPVDHSPQMALLRRLKQIDGVKQARVGSGVRYDLVLADRAHGDAYLEALLKDHVAGQMKVAPEHTQPAVLELMGKPGTESLLAFKRRFELINRKLGKRQFLTYYFIAAYPGCSMQDMQQVRTFASRELHLLPEQVQIFTPTPSTYATLMYYTEMNPFTGEKIFVEKSLRQKNRQKQILLEKSRNTARHER
jgi:uncharacterized radical SAM protein YgiQ